MKAKTPILDVRSLIHPNHFTCPDFKQRMTTQDWKKILLANEDTIIYCGTRYNLFAKKIGFGVVEVQKEMF